MQEEIVKEKKTTTSYDENPYVSNAYSHASHENYYNIAKIFGLDPVHPAKAKVLDLGCASGGNIIGMAAKYPKSTFVGVDLSSVQIEDGKNQIKDLGLKNIELKAMSILDIDESLGKFDYIVCHGVFAWVPKEVQDKILEICNTNLTEKGVAHVSYNALPGWNVPNSFREMMMYHSASFENPADKIQQSKALMEFVKESLAEADTPYAQMLRTEAAHVGAAYDSYFLHEYLDKGNSEFYFADFMAEAAKHNLVYLADGNISTMYVGNLPEKAAKKLAEITDIVRVEQYMDFVTNRRFRNTLLCKPSNQINRNVNSQILDEAYVSIPATPSIKKEMVDFSKDDASAKFTLGKGGATCETNHSTQTAMFYVLSEQTNAISIRALFDGIKKLYPNFDEKTHGDQVRTQLLEFIFKGFATVSFVEPGTVNKISEKPVANPVAIYQASKNNLWLVNYQNDSIQADDVMRFVISNCDGKHNKEDLTKKFDAWLKKMDKHVEQDGKTVTDEKLRSQLLGQMVESSLQFALNCGLLIK